MMKTKDKEGMDPKDEAKPRWVLAKKGGLRKSDCRTESVRRLLRRMSANSVSLAFLSDQ